MTILGIDTSGNTASVAIVGDNSVLAQTTFLTKRTHSQVILPLCKELLKNTGIELRDIDGIAVANGPGSYTGLRIGISAVKAMAYALDIKCIGISTLESLAYNFMGIDTIVCSVMAARQNLVYTALFSSENGVIKRLTDDRIITVEELDNSLLEYKSVMLVGDYSEKFFNDHKKAGYVLAPSHLRLQLASSLCFSALDKEMYTCDKLDASYLQITQAEKIKYGIN